MKFLKKFHNWEMKRVNKPENLIGIGIALGVLFGYAIDNVGVGIALGVAIGAGMAANRKKAIEKENDEASQGHSLEPDENQLN